MKKSLLTMLFITLLLASLSAVPRNLVIVEIGTGTWCQYCPGAAMGADDLIDNGHSVAIIENHNGDPYANNYSNARNSYYGITGYPSATFDGLNLISGGSHTVSMYPNYLPRVNARMAIPSKYTLGLSGSATGNTFNVEVAVAKVEDDTNTNVTLHVVLTESEIQQVWQGQTHLNFVTRMMLPSQTGTPVNLTTGETANMPFSFEWNPAWSMDHAEIIVFLQNNTTKEILQGFKSSLPGLVGAYPGSMTEVNFIDTYLTGTDTVPITFTNYQNYAVNGTIAIDNPAFSISPSTMSIAPYQTATYNVIFTPTAAQNYTGTLTINSNLYMNNLITIPLNGLGFLNAAPVANNVAISGPPVIHQTLTANYDFVDADANTEGDSEFQWIRMINNNPVPIEGANTMTYIVQDADLGYAIKFQVTPKDQYNMPGTTVLSDATLQIEPLPVPRNLAAVLTPPNTVVLTWQKPMYFDTRGFVGYRIYRNDLLIQSSANVNTLTFTDTYVPAGENQYWVKAWFNNPNEVSEASNVVTVMISVANDDNVAALQESVSCYPNPFHDLTNINIKASNNSPVALDIYNVKGQLVKSLSAKTDQNGVSNLTWDGTDTNNNTVNNGIYLYRAKLSTVTKTGKIILNK